MSLRQTLSLVFCLWILGILHCNVLAQKIEISPANPDRIVLFLADGCNLYHSIRLLDYPIIDPNITYAKFPRRQGIGTHWLSVARHDRRLMPQ